MTSSGIGGARVRSRAGSDLARWFLAGSNYAGRFRGNARPGRAWQVSSVAKVAISDGQPVTTEIAELTAGSEDQPKTQCSFCGKRRDQTAEELG